MMPPHAVGGRPAFQAGGEGSNPSGGTTYPVVCVCENPEWIDDAGDGWQYCANCRELARPIDGEMASSANGLGSQALNLETLGSNPAEATNPFDHLPTEVAAKDLTGFINAYIALDEQVRKDFDTCVLWTGAGSRKNGHSGVVRRYGIHKTVKSQTPFRYVWEQVNKVPVQEGMEIGHICKSPKNLCVNPNHLFSGTREAVCILHSAQGRLAKVKQTHCKYGHPIAGVNEYIYYYKNGLERRCCKKCRNRVAREGNRRRTGAKPRVKRKHPNMSNPEQVCRKGLHRFTYQNTAVYFNKTYGRWNRVCRKCANKRCRILQRKYYGYKPLPKFRSETFLQ